MANASIYVAVRVRPLMEREKSQMDPEQTHSTFHSAASFAATPTAYLGLRRVVDVVDDKMLVFDPPEEGYQQPLKRLTKRRHKDAKFAFDRVFHEDSTQKDVYTATTQPLINSILEGFNSTVFAYGATGCGKTHTISGTSEDPGIIFLTMRELFDRIAEIRDEKVVEVSITFLEVYNEMIKDLLRPKSDGGQLALREDAKQGVTVAGLSQHYPKGPEEIMQLLFLGNSNRTISPTEANATSSRSHAVLQVNVRQRPRTASIVTEFSVATMSIIDLAGSERASSTKGRPQGRNEGANINRSLLALGNCINALCDVGKKSHIPYRDSKLTRLLKFSLGGNCRTVMIVCISPTSQYYEETHNTLKYASRAKSIKMKLRRNTVKVDMHVSQYVKIIQELKKEVAELKSKVSGESRTTRKRSLEMVEPRPSLSVLGERFSSIRQSEEKIGQITACSDITDAYLSTLSEWSKMLGNKAAPYQKSIEDLRNFLCKSVNSRQSDKSKLVALEEQIVNRFNREHGGENLEVFRELFQHKIENAKLREQNRIYQLFCSEYVKEDFKAFTELDSKCIVNLRSVGDQLKNSGCKADGDDVNFLYMQAIHHFSQALQRIKSLENMEDKNIVKKAPVKKEEPKKSSLRSSERITQKKSVDFLPQNNLAKKMKLDVIDETRKENLKPDSSFSISKSLLETPQKSVTGPIRTNGARRQSRQVEPIGRSNMVATRLRRATMTNGLIGGPTRATRESMRLERSRRSVLPGEIKAVRGVKAILPQNNSRRKSVVIGRPLWK